MRLHKAAVRFDDSVLHDAYTGHFIGKGQLDPTDIFKLDGASVRRRILSVSPDVAIPARRAARLGAEVYLFGEASPDEWNGAPIRVKYVLHQTPGRAKVFTFAEALRGQPGREMYASREWNKDVPDNQASSRYFNDYHIFVAASEPLAPFDLIFIDDQWHICHAVHPSLSGFKDAVSHEITGMVFEYAEIGVRKYDPVTDDWDATHADVMVLRLRWQEQYDYLRASQENYQRGDETLVIADEGYRPKPSDGILLSDGRWRILASQEGAGVWLLHARRD